MKDMNRMIGSVGPDIPHPLFAATGRNAGLLRWNVDREFPLAAKWLESKFPLWAFSIVEDWAAGAFDHLEAVVFSRGDDAAQRLYYYLCELQRRGMVAGPEPIIMDVARIARAGSEQRCIDAVRKLAVRFDTDDAEIEAAIVASNFHLGASASDGDGRPTCLLAGTLPPDRRLHDMIGANDWNPAGVTMVEAWEHPQTAIEEASGDPCAALGEYVYRHSGGPRSFHDRAADVVTKARTAKAAAVVLWYSEEDEAEIWNLPAQRQALADAAIPTLVLTRRSWRADDDVAAEISAFLKERSQ